MLGGAKGKCDCVTGGVNEESHHHARGHNFRICALLLVQVPGASNAKELASISPAIQEYDHQVDKL